MTDLRQLAASILAGDWTKLPGGNFNAGYFEVADWQSEADYALEGGDFAQLAAMLETERDYADFSAWAYSNDPDGDVDFEDWREGYRGASFNPSRVHPDDPCQSKGVA